MKSVNWLSSDAATTTTCVEEGRRFEQPPPGTAHPAQKVKVEQYDDDDVELDDEVSGLSRTSLITGYVSGPFR